MKILVALVLSIGSLFALPATAEDSQIMNSKSCSERSALLPIAERKAFLQSCLERASSRENVKEIALQRKKVTCEQNAKNYKLQGQEKDSYVQACINKNEAAVVAAADAEKKSMVAPAGDKPAAEMEKKSGSPDGKNPANQAVEQKLGDNAAAQHNKSAKQNSKPKSKKAKAKHKAKTAPKPKQSGEAAKAK